MGVFAGLRLESFVGSGIIFNARMTHSKNPTNKFQVELPCGFGSFAVMRLESSAGMRLESSAGISLESYVAGFGDCI